MAERQLTTVQLDQDTKSKLKRLADYFKRSQAGQLSWMVDQEFERVADYLPDDLEQNKKNNK